MSIPSSLFFCSSFVYPFILYNGFQVVKVVYGFYIVYGSPFWHLIDIILVANIQIAALFMESK